MIFDIIFVLLNAKVERAVDITMKTLFYGLVVLVFLIPALLLLKLILKLIHEVKISDIESKIRKVGISEVKLRSINKEQVDDTYERALIGRILAGDAGMIAGAASGGYREKISSLTFWVRYKDGSKEQLVLKPSDNLSSTLLRKIDQKDFSRW